MGDILMLASWHPPILFLVSVEQIVVLPMLELRGYIGTQAAALNQQIKS